MIRGTTPIITINTDVDLSDAEVIFITFSQLGQRKIEKELESIEVTETSLVVDLSQEDTLKLDSQRAVEIQIRARFSGGRAIASNVMTASVKRILKEGVI